MNIKEKINQDLKTAMLAGDKVCVSTLKMVKSAVQYAEVDSGNRSEGLPDEEIVSVLQKESKKRGESAELYRSGGSLERANAELAEKEIIDAYLPQQMSEEELGTVIDKNISKLGQPSMSDLGTVISSVIKSVGGRADSSLIAKLVKEKLT